MDHGNKSQPVKFKALRLVAIGCAFAAASLIWVQPGAVAQTPATAQKAASGNVENGKKIYLAKRCWECHDYEGQGGSGPRIGPPRLPLAAVITYIRAPKGQMPPYLAKVVSDAEVADIYAFLQSAQKPTPAKDIPLLNF